MDISSILASYNISQLTIGTLGGHSALDICMGAKKYGFKTVCVAQKSRSETYAKYYKTRERGSKKIGCIDELILVDKFEDIMNEDVQEKLRSLNTLFVHNRYFWTYCNFKENEQKFKVPIIGSRELLKLEERDIPKNQYYLLEQAGIRIPKIYQTPNLTFAGGVLEASANESFQSMKGLVLTKVNNAIRTYERENFVASSPHEWVALAEDKLNKGLVTLEALQNSVIEEFVLGAQINFNFFYSSVHDSLELMGTDTRRQTSLDGWLRLPARDQLKIPAQFAPHYIETGHIAVTCKESLLEKAFTAADSFVKTCAREGFPLHGAFALQGAISTDGSKEEFLVFDVSMRVPGSPGIFATPYTSYLYGESVTMGERIALEVKDALGANKLESILS